jgi:hypothetical protein
MKHGEFDSSASTQHGTCSAFFTIHMFQLFFCFHEVARISKPVSEPDRIMAQGGKGGSQGKSQAHNESIGELGATQKGAIRPSINGKSPALSPRHATSCCLSLHVY